MKLSRSLFGCLTLLAATTGAFAAMTPATNAPPAAPAPPPAKSASKLDNYINELATPLKLTDAEKKEIEGYYVADGDPLKKILNDDTLSPLQQARQVSDLRDARNVKIEALLDDLDRQHEFLKIEARYRVALTELAANGGLVAAPPPAPAGGAPATNAPPAAK